MKPFLEICRSPTTPPGPCSTAGSTTPFPSSGTTIPNIELTLTLNSRGQRFIGDHIGDYDDGDLVLIGPYLPHTWSSIDKADPAEPHIALVMWFLPDWADHLTAKFPELRSVGAMLTRAAAGLHFSPATSAAARPLVEALFQRPPTERFLLLLQVLSLLAADRNAIPLAATAPNTTGPTAERTRIDRVLDHIHANFAEPITITALSDIAALSPSGLHRIFLRHTHQTVSQYLIRLRIGRACALLSATALPIAQIAADVGYDSLANFNRQFKALKGATPRQYRQAFL